MKKVVLLFLCLFLVIGCKDEKKTIENKVEEKKFVLEKVDSNKDYVYFNNHKEVELSSGKYVFKYPIINIKSEEIDNLNLELKNFVIRSYKDSEIYENYLNSGNIVNYDYYVTDEYISIVQSSYYYIDGMIGEHSDKVYVVSLKNGKIISNDKILDNHGINEETLYELLESKIVSDDIAYTLKSIKDNGYSLYINDSDKLCIIFYEITDEEEIRKELVLN